jgi:hypothetical protein
MSGNIAWFDRYLDVLDDRLGIACEVTDDGRAIQLGHGGLTFWIANPGPSDPEYLRIVTAVKIEDDVAESALTEIVARTSRQLKLVKAHVSESWVELAVEMLVAGNDQLPAREHLAAVLPRSLQALHCGVRDITKEISDARDAAVLAGIEAATLAAYGECDDA